MLSYASVIFSSGGFDSVASQWSRMKNTWLGDSDLSRNVNTYVSVMYGICMVLYIMSSVTVLTCIEVATYVSMCPPARTTN